MSHSAERSTPPKLAARFADFERKSGLQTLLASTCSAGTRKINLQGSFEISIEYREKATALLQATRFKTSPGRDDGATLSRQPPLFTLYSQGETKQEQSQIRFGFD